MTHYPSNRQIAGYPRYLALGVVAVLAVVLPTLYSFAALVTTDRYIVPNGDAVAEDQYVTSVSAQVEGVIDGDLTIFTGGLTIAGEVTGSVHVFTYGSVKILEGARIGGSLNGTAGTTLIAGSVGGDVFIGSPSVVVDPSGVVGRDLMAFGGALTMNGDVGRDVRGRTMRMEINGTVGGDVDVAAQGLDIGPDGDIGGDVLYRSATDADIDAAAHISGTLTKLPAQSNFVYGIILMLANVVSFLGFIVAGIGAIWALRSSSSRAVGMVLKKPVRSVLAGVGIVIVFPATVLVLAVTLVGLPLAVIGVLLAGIAFVVGPVPVVTALGNRVLVNRGGLFGAFVTGAILWRLGIWLVPVVGGFLYLIALVWGIGAWVLGLAAARRNDPVPPALLPASMIVTEQVPEGWEPPLAPSQRPEPRTETAGEMVGEGAAVGAPESQSDSDPSGPAVSPDTEEGAPDPSRIVFDDYPEAEQSSAVDRDVKAEWEEELSRIEGPEGPTDDPPGGTPDWGLPNR